MTVFFTGGTYPQIHGSLVFRVSLFTLWPPAFDRRPLPVEDTGLSQNVSSSPACLPKSRRTWAAPPPFA